MFKYDATPAERTRKKRKREKEKNEIKNVEEREKRSKQDGDRLSIFICTDRLCNRYINLSIVYDLSP